MVTNIISAFVSLEQAATSPLGLELVTPLLEPIRPSYELLGMNENKEAGPEIAADTGDGVEADDHFADPLSG